ncbi:MAG: radical SAM protein [Pseudomonadota bacterium]|nr:radical SAM protein [Pseudomonadota bacterium]
MGELKSKVAIEELQNKNNRPLIIFGAGAIGEMTYHACKQYGLEVACFTDDKKKGVLGGLDIVHTNDLKKSYIDPIFLISSANIQDMTERLSDLGYSKWYSCGIVLKGFDVSPEHCNAERELEQDYVDYLVSSCILAQESFMDPKKLFTKNIDLVITEKCSMACVDCSNLMPYFESPRNYTLETLMHAIDILCQYFDEIYEIRVIGGEPFMNKDFHQIVKRLTQEPKVEKVAIYTNGTIVPNEVQLEELKHEKLFLYITDYGKLSRNLEKLVVKLQENNIFHYVHKAADWTDCASLEKHNRTVDENIDLFKKCCAKNLATVSENKLFRCPFAANAFQLKGIPDDPDDYIDLQKLEESNIGSVEASQRIKQFLLDKEYIPACDYCAGRSYGDLEITPGIQTKEKRAYVKYERD